MEQGSLETGNTIYTHPQGVLLPPRDPGPSSIISSLPNPAPNRHTPTPITTQIFHGLTLFRKVIFIISWPATCLHVPMRIRNGCKTDGWQILAATGQVFMRVLLRCLGSWTGSEILCWSLLGALVVAQQQLRQLTLIIIIIICALIARKVN